jgi:hypothetical protein
MMQGFATPERAMCHEAGHVVVALCQGFRVERVERHQRYFRTVVPPPTDPADLRKYYVYAAGGIAAETFRLTRYDDNGAGADRQTIISAGGGPIETYLPEALGLIRVNESCFTEILSMLLSKYIEGLHVAAHSEDADSFRIASGSEIQATWRQCCTKVVADRERHVR